MTFCCTAEESYLQEQQREQTEFDFLFLTQVHQSSQSQLDGPAEILGNEDPSGSPHRRNFEGTF